ncbi:uncharacterized protein LOC116159095 isoform X2 [Photinus pyralis]|uniref:uncharacterized protein LOC116159095 isoform X2 n=1 Tax=Photinus pyralis TaxID=7054 RepID=UPI001266FD17|nr:uncharacterized protein LOC116159095 isoform X2 [Photinus pyralis]
MWKSLREKYTRERKKITNRPSGSGATTTPVWTWFGDLQFLDECIQQRRVDRNSSNVITSLNTSLGDSVIVEEEEEVASGESYSSEFCNEGVHYESANIDLNETLRNTESVESLLPNAGTTSSSKISEACSKEKNVIHVLLV